MPGFGYGAFGHMPFGEWWWSRAVLYELLPAEYQRNDADQNYVLEKFMETLRLSFNNMRKKIRDLNYIRDPLYARTRYNELTYLRLGKVIVENGEIEQKGVDGRVLSTKEFYSETARFDVTDIGKNLVIRGSSVGSNNKGVMIASITGPSIVLTDPLLVFDAGPFVWEVRSSAVQSLNSVRVEVRGGDVSGINPSWIVNDGYMDFPVVARKQFPFYEDKRLLTEQEGLDGIIDSLGRFVVSTARFKQEDVGKRLSILDSTITDNLNRFEIVRVIDAYTVVLDVVLVADAGPLTWSLLPFSELTLYGLSPLPKGIVQQDGADGALNAGSPNIFSAPSAVFTSGDIGRILRIWGSATVTNDGIYTISGWVSDTEVTFVAAGIVSDIGAGIRWEVRDLTGRGDGTQVEVHASDMLMLLARDFGIEVDNREDEDFQRRWVKNISRWINRKGWKNTYEFIAKLTGFSCEVTHLYRVSQDIATSIPAEVLIPVGEHSPGRSGLDGALFLYVGFIRFYSSTAAFLSSDVGRQIYIGNSLIGNNGYRTIDKVVNVHTVQFRSVDVAITPDPVGYPSIDGDLEWMIVRLYSSYGPTLPVYDEINVDLMTLIKTSVKFTADMYCWEVDWSTTIGPGFGGGGDGDLRIIAVTPAVASPFPVVYTVKVDGDIDVVVGLGVGKWKLTDNNGTTFFLESVPILELETGVGRAGTDGSILVGPNFFSPTAAFVAGDVGKRITLSKVGSAHNERIYKIASVIDPQTVVLAEDPPTIPDSNNGSIKWAVAFFTFPVKATEPPDIGAATIEYICAVQPTCSFCPSNKVLVKASTSLLMEEPFDRLVDRLEQVKSAHVEIVYSMGLEIEASLFLTASVEIP
jgi:hypothetical protein